MRVAIMQPYFFPYIGYFQLIGAVDLFIVYDNIKYTKKGWINRNRMLQDGKDVVFSLPLKNDSDSLDVRERVLANDFNRNKLLNQIRGSYQQAPHFAEVFPMVERAVRHHDANLFRFLHHALICACQHLELKTPVQVSSSIEVDHSLRSQERVIALSKAVGATTYVNAIGGLELYDRDVFCEHGLDLKFIRSKPFEYRQYDSSFVPWLSIIDVLMFNPLDTARTTLSNHYEIL
jgi:hypothetical protein